MKRDMDLILRILRWTEENAKAKPLDIPDLEGIQPYEVAYHVLLCYEAGFLHVDIKEADTRKSVRIVSLSWQGHEYLDAHRD